MVEASTHWSMEELLRVTLSTPTAEDGRRKWTGGPTRSPPRTTRHDSCDSRFARATRILTAVRQQTIREVGRSSATALTNIKDMHVATRARSKSFAVPRTPSLTTGVRAPAMPSDTDDAIDESHVSRSRQTYLAIRDRIVRGELPPESRLIEAQLASDLGVSRTPIRDALAQLTRDGFVVAGRPARRLELTVAPLRHSAVDELWTLIGGIEWAALGRLGRLSPAEQRALADRLEEINDQLRSLMKPRKAAA